MTLKTCTKRIWMCGVALALAAAPSTLKAQDEWGKTGLNTLWQGLRQTQPDDQMPKGNAPFQTPQRLAKKTIPGQLILSDKTNEWIIADGWELGTSTDVLESGESIFDPTFNTANWYNATVPGTVLTTLVNQGVYPEPSYGLNNLAIPDTLCKMDWWYRVSFDHPAGNIGDRTILLFNGINYRAEVFLNGKKLGNIEGAFIRGEYDVTEVIKPMGNVLAVLIHPPYNPGIPHEQSMVAGQGLNGGQLSLDGPTFIASMGWDWIPGIRDRNIGLWQDVRLQVTGTVKIGDPHVISNLPLPDTTSAKVTIQVPLKNLTDRSVSGIVHARFEGVDVNMPYSLNAREEKVIVFDPKAHQALNVQNPRLWWPNGYGAPNLYNLELQAEVGGRSSDVRKVRFGIRELSYELMVNTPEKGNHRIGYTPVDAPHNNKPLFDYEKILRDTPSIWSEAIPTLQPGVDENRMFEQLPDDDPVGRYLVFRVNGQRIFIKGGTSGMDEMMKRISRQTLEPFFQLEKAANFNMIRNWTGENTEELFYELADEYGLLVWNDFWITTDDTVDPNDHVLFLKNATDVVKRFRTHPSIAIWCPRNEGFAPKGLEHQLNEMIAREDGTRHYHGNSRMLNAVNSGPYGFIKDQEQYFTRFARGFNTELGAQAIPTANTIRKFIAPEDQWPINDVWAYHDLHHTTHFFQDFMAAVNSYGEAQSLDDFARQAQMVTYDTWRAMIEGVNSRMWDNTTGLILWMSHPSWPSMTWQTHTYDFETPGSYFGVKKAQEPLHVQMNQPDNQIVILNNTRVDQKDMTVTVKFYRLDGKEYFKKSGKFDALAGQKTTCFDANLLTDDVPPYTLVRLELRTRNGAVVSINDYWKNWGNLQANQALSELSQVKLQVKVKDHKKPKAYTVEVTNPTKTIAVGIKLNAYDKNGDMILPAFFSDGYFNLLPGEKRVIALDLPVHMPLLEVGASGFNIQ